MTHPMRALSLMIALLVACGAAFAEDKNYKKECDHWIKELKGEDPIRRAKARDNLVAIGKEAVPFLTAALEDGRPQVCWNIALALGKIKDPETVKTLIEVLVARKGNKSEEYQGVRGFCCLALGKLRDDKATYPLLDILNSDDASFPRRCAAFALGNIGSAKAIPVLAKIARESTSDKYLRAACVLGLGLCGAEKEVPLIVGFLKDKEALVLDSAVLALGFIASPASVQPLASLSTHKRDSVRNSAALCLGWIDNAGARRELEKFCKDEDEWVRVAAAIAAYSYDKARSKKMLLEAARSGDADASAYATVALCVFPNDKEVAATVLRLAASDNNFVRMNAASTLGFLRDPAAVKVLCALAGDKEEFIRGEAVRALAEFDTPESRATLVESLKKDEDAYVRSRSAINLNTFSEVPVLDALVRALKDPEDDVRADAMRALGRITSMLDEKKKKIVESAVDAALLKEKYVTVEKAGELCKEAIKNGAASPKLMAEIADRTHRVGGRIADELGRLLYFTTLRVMELGLDTDTPFQTLVVTYYTTCGGIHNPITYTRLIPYISTIGHATRDLKTFTGKDQYFDRKLERKTDETAAGGGDNSQPPAK